MALTTEEKRQKMIASADRAREKARARALEKLNDPQYREEQRDKQRASLQRRQQRQRERQLSPEYQAKQAAKRSKPKAVATSKPPAPQRRTKSSKGLKGRAPDASERRIMDALGALPCIACLMHGIVAVEISLHHIDGRTKPGAHKLVLPLCKWHHQYAAPIEIRAIHPWLVPVHADGNAGGKREFERLNKPQLELLAEAYEKAGLPFEKDTNLMFN